MARETGNESGMLATFLTSVSAATQEASMNS
jgi:hypothetical protein